MKVKVVTTAFVTGILLLFVSAGFSQEAISPNEWVEKIGQGSVNWSAGYIEAVGIGAPPDASAGRINARPMALRAAKVDAYRNLLEMTKGVQVDASTSVRDYTVESDVVTTQVEGLVKGAYVVDQQYMSDGTVEVKMRMPLYGNLSGIVIPLAITKQKEAPPAPEVPSPQAVPDPETPAAPPEPPAPAVAPAPASTAPPVPIAYTGLVVDARGIGARPAMSPRIFDENGNEIYGSAHVERDYAISQGMSGYARDLTAAQSNQRVTANPLTVKAIKTGGAGKADLVVSSADVKMIQESADHAAFLKQCRVMIVLD